MSERRECDVCGRILMEHEHTSVELVIRQNGDVTFEWWQKGEYCFECNNKLHNAIVAALNVPERCDAVFRNDDTARAIEAALIKREDE